MPASDAPGVEPTPTRAYDFGEPSQHDRFGGTLHSDDADTDTRKFDTDDLEGVRQPGVASSGDEPTQVFSQAPAAGAGAAAGFAAQPQQHTPRWQDNSGYGTPQQRQPQAQPQRQERDLRAPGFLPDDRGVNVVALLEARGPGPGAGARVTSLVLSLILFAVTIFLVVDLKTALMSPTESLVTGPLLRSLPTSDLLSTAIAGIIVALLPSVVTALFGLFSGLGPGLVGFVMTVSSILMLVMGVGWTEHFEAAWGALIAVGVFLMIVGLVAHVARGAGYRRARRIVREGLHR